LLTPITKEEFINKRWLKHKSFEFAKLKGVVQLSAMEFPKAALSYPIGFLKQNDEFLAVALMGIEPTRNLYIDKKGNFLANYIPALIRISPFTLATSNTSEKIICVDETIVYGNEGEPFFEPDGSLSEPLQKIRDFLSAFDANITHTQKAIAALNEAKLIKPWDLQIPTKSGIKRIEGLYCIDEAGLNTIDKDTLVNLRDIGALVIVYCQLISMQNIEVIGKLADYHDQLDQAEFNHISKTDLDFSFLN
jgi:hypothetical protein